MFSVWANAADVENKVTAISTSSSIVVLFFMVNLLVLKGKTLWLCGLCLPCEILVALYLTGAREI